MKHFSKIRHPEWTKNEPKWEFAWDHYDGSYADWNMSVSKVSEYLHQKYQRENNKAYEERMKVSDVVLHFATIIDGVNGVVATKEKDTVRDLGALATYDEEGELEVNSDAYRILNNADGNGTNLVPLMKRVGIMQTVLHSVWGYVEGVTERSDHATIKVIKPQHVVNWYPSTGELEEVLVKEQIDTRDGITSEQNDDDEIYTLFTLDGWRRFKIKKETQGSNVIETEVEIDSGEYEYWDSTERRRRILPIFKTPIPMPRPVGYLLAQKENHLYNAVSVRDFALRNLSFSMLNLNVETEEEYQAILNQLEKGANVVASYGDRDPHSFFSPDGSYLSDFEAVLQNKIEEYYTNGFKKFGEAASQVTATQVRLENQSGIESFLALLVSSIDEFENQCYKRIEQVYFPEDSSKWGLASVKRSRNFQAEDVQEAFRTIVEAVQKAEQSKSMSMEERVRRINPTWGDKEIKEEVDRIIKEMSNDIPDPFSVGA